MKLEIGYNHTFEVRKETCSADCNDSFSVLYLSDLHLNKFSEPIAARITAALSELNPDIILFGGDYVDSKGGLVYLHQLLRAIPEHSRVFAIAGNHDKHFGLQEIESAFRNNRVEWLEGSSANVRIGSTVVQIDGQESREESSSDFSILLLHEPVNPETFKHKYNLALAGHLHGCQFVFWKNDKGLYPGKFFYQWNISRAQLNGCTFIVSKGLGDTLPIRYNCRRDMLYIEVKGKNQISRL